MFNDGGCILIDREVTKIKGSFIDHVVIFLVMFEKVFVYISYKYTC